MLNPLNPLSLPKEKFLLVKVTVVSKQSKEQQRNFYYKLEEGVTNYWNSFVHLQDQIKEFRVKVFKEKESGSCELSWMDDCGDKILFRDGHREDDLKTLIKFIENTNKTHIHLISE